MKLPGKALGGIFSREGVVRNLSGLLAMVLLFILFQTFYLRPKQSKINEVSIRLRTLSGEVAQIQERVYEKKRMAAREAEVLADYQRMEARLDRARRMLPSRENIAELLETLTRPASGHNVSILNVQPFPPEDMADLVHLSFKMQLKGRYRDIGLYLNDIARIDRLILVDNLQLTQREGGDRNLDAQLLLSTYLMKEVK